MLNFLRYNCTLGFLFSLPLSHVPSLIILKFEYIKLLSLCKSAVSPSYTHHVEVNVVSFLTLPFLDPYIFLGPLFSDVYDADQSFKVRDCVSHLYNTIFRTVMYPDQQKQTPWL